MINVWCQIVHLCIDGVKLVPVSNGLRCQIDSFTLVVSNWLFYTRGVKLTPLHFWCQIGPVSNWLRCQIVLQSPETLKGSLRPHSKNPWDHPQRLSETTLKGSLRPGSIMLQPRQLWLEAHSCLRRHIWLVVIRASFANQVDVNDYVFLTQMWKTSSSTLLLVMAHISTIFTWLRTFVANSASSRLRAFWEAPLKAPWDHHQRLPVTTLKGSLRPPLKLATLKGSQKPSRAVRALGEA